MRIIWTRGVSSTRRESFKIPFTVGECLLSEVRMTLSYSNAKIFQRTREDHAVFMTNSKHKSTTTLHYIYADIVAVERRPYI